MLPSSWRTELWYAAARVAGTFSRVSARPARTPLPEPDTESLPDGISVVIPSRNGRNLLCAQLPGLAEDMASPGEIIAVDNGSDDGTAAWLSTEWPGVHVEFSPEPLSFAAAANKGIAAARYRRVCLLNNDMLLAPGFFSALEAAFDRMPYLFSATAQIMFPPGVRREETGKAVMAQAQPEDFPIRCDEPLPGEDCTWVLYGSGGCSLYDTAKLRALGGMDEVYAPAYVEDLDVGYRAWQRGWPSVYVAGAVVEHRHRATTSRYFSSAELDRILEINYLRFLTRAVADPDLFSRLWDRAIRRLRLRSPRDPAARAALRAGALIALETEAGPSRPELSAQREVEFLALTDGSVAVFPAHPPTGKPVQIVAASSARLPATRPAGWQEFDTVLVTSLPGPAAGLSPLGLETVAIWGEPPSHAVLRAAFSESVRKWNPEKALVHPEWMDLLGGLSLPINPGPL